MLVDDNLEAARLMSKLLTRCGHEVLTADNGRSGINQAVTFQPKAVISDIGMPELTGYDLARELRNLEPFKDTLLIALSGYGQPLDVETAITAGFDYHMTKPCDFDQLKALLVSQSPH